MDTKVPGWRELPLGDIANFRLGGNYKNTVVPTARPLIKMGNIARVTIDVSEVEYIPDSVTVDPMHRLRFGDVLFNTRNTLDLVGKVSIWRNELPRAYYNSNILRLEFKPAYSGDSRYFGYALNSTQSVEAIRALATGTTSVAAVYSRDLRKLTVSVPSKAEQMHIASTLADTDDWIDGLKRLIAKKQSIKQGMMQQLITGRTRLPGFKGDWTPRRLGDVASMSSGGTPPREVSKFFGGRIPWVSISDMTNSGKYVASTDMTLTEEGLEASAAKLYEPDVVLYAMYASLGEVSLAVGQVSSSQAILGISPGADLDREYLYYYLESVKSVVKNLGQQGTQSNLNAGMVRDFKLDLPKYDEQIAIAKALSEMDDEISTLQQRLEKANDIKTGMMQQLLTGRVRLPVEVAV